MKMQIFLKLVLSLTAFCSVLTAAAAKPTDNQTPQVDWQHIQWWAGAHPRLLFTSSITDDVTTSMQTKAEKAATIHENPANFNKKHTSEKISPQLNRLSATLSQSEWPGLQPQQMGFQPQTTQFFYQQPHFQNSPQFPNISPQFPFHKPNFIYPYSPFTPQFPIPAAGIPPSAATPTATTTTTERPSKKKEREPTTPTPFFKRSNSQPSLIKTPTQFDTSDIRNDAPLLASVRKINPYFVIEDIQPVPGKEVHLNNEKASEIGEGPPTAPKTKTLSKKVTKLGKRKMSLIPKADSVIKAEAIGKTSTFGAVPEIPFGTYFLPYLSEKQLGSGGGRVASLILEPHSKAVVGNGGKAVSKPISRAFLKEGVPTNVYFNPESVAIAGVGGKAHAEAALELDVISQRL